MQLLQRIGAGIALCGIVLVMLGGMTVRGGPDGTWVQVNFVHGVGGVAIILGTVLSLIAAGGVKAKAEEDETAVPKKVV